MAADAACYLYAAVFQVGCNESGSLFFFEAQFRVGVQLAANAHEFGFEGGDGRQSCHGVVNGKRGGQREARARICRPGQGLRQKGRDQALALAAVCAAGAGRNRVSSTALTMAAPDR